MARARSRIFLCFISYHAINLGGNTCKAVHIGDGNDGEGVATITGAVAAATAGWVSTGDGAVAIITVLCSVGMVAGPLATLITVVAAAFVAAVPIGS
jgi:hypothetical protein